MQPKMLIAQLELMSNVIAKAGNINGDNIFYLVLDSGLYKGKILSHKNQNKFQTI